MTLYYDPETSPRCCVCGEPIGEGEYAYLRAVFEGGVQTVSQAWHPRCAPIDGREETTDWSCTCSRVMYSTSQDPTPRWMPGEIDPYCPQHGDHP